MRVASFNVQHGRGADGVVDVDRLVAACARLDADVLALQEVDRLVPRSGRRDLAAEVASATGTAMAFAAAQPLDGGAYGNALLVRGRIDEVHALRLPRRGRAERRGALVARVAVGGASLTVAVAHLGVTQAESAVQLDALLRVLAHHPRPWLLAGDLNRHPGQVGDRLAVAGLERAESPATYPAGAPWASIDHVAVAGLRVGEATAVATPVSDHLALVVEVSPR